MSSVPIDLPLKPSEASALADLIFQVADGRALNDDLRNRLNGRLAGLELTGVTAYMGSLQKDPAHSSAYYIAVDAITEGQVNPLLLRMALASSPASAHFPDPILIGRMRPGGGREIVVNAIPFGPGDYQNIRTFAQDIDRSFYPRPQGAQPALTVVVQRPELEIPAAFDAFKVISRKYGVNWASIGADHEASSEHVYCTALWAAIRAGWREGYGLSITLPEDAGEASRVIADAAGFTRFCVTPENEQFFDVIERVKSPRMASKHFDFEISLTGRATPTAAGELADLLDGLKSRGRTAQLVAPRFDDFGAVTALAPIARQFNAVLSFRLGANVEEQVLENIGRDTSARFSVTVDLARGTRAEIIDRVVTIASNLRG